jgi:hypothetical protein
VFADRLKQSVLEVEEAAEAVAARVQQQAPEPLQCVVELLVELPVVPALVRLLAPVAVLRTPAFLESSLVERG